MKALYAQYGDGDFVTNVYAFADFAGEYQHNLFLDGLLKRLYQEAGISLWVVVIADGIPMRRQYDAIGTNLIPQVIVLSLEWGLLRPNGMRILPAFGSKSPCELAIALIAGSGAAPIAHSFRIYCKELVPDGHEFFISLPVRDHPM